MSTTTSNKIKEIYLEKLKLQFHKVRKDYLVYLKTKSIPSRKNMTTMPSIGTIVADLDKAVNTITLFKRIAKKSNNDGWEELKSFTPTKIDYDRTSFSRIYYKTQKYIHRDIIMTKEDVDVWFEQGHAECTGSELCDYLFNGIKISSYKPYKEVEQTSYLNVPDDELSMEQLTIKMREEVDANVGVCPF